MTITISESTSFNLVHPFAIDVKRGEKMGKEDLSHGVSGCSDLEESTYVAINEIWFSLMSIQIALEDAPPLMTNMTRKFKVFLVTVTFIGFSMSCQF